MSVFTRIFLLTKLFLLFSFSAFSQQDSTNTNDDDQMISRNMKGFHLGLQAGTFFANKYTTNLYNGYGLDVNGNLNSFTNSFINQRLLAYAGNGIQPDYVAQALGVQPGQWSFDETGMPINLKYNVALLVGLNTRYCFNNKSAIILNVNASKLSVSGDITINTLTPNANTLQGGMSVNTFPIVGGEQRLITQLGFQQILGDNPVLNFFVEGGVDMTLAKFLRNQVIINSLTIDLGNYYSQPAYGSVRSKNLIGLGFGVFAGAGLNLTLGNKFTIQLVYNPSYDKINIGASPKLTFQNSIGLRAYYNF